MSVGDGRGSTRQVELGSCHVVNVAVNPTT